MHKPSSLNHNFLVPAYLSGGGEMGKRIRSLDWNSTPLGPVDRWPQSLQSALSICLNSNFPIAIYWSKELILLYNDAWSPIPGNKHPAALGKPAKEVWPEIWEFIEPQFQKAFTGIPGGSKDALLPMLRHGYTEECYFDFTFTPVYGEGGKVEGVFNAVIETTSTVLNERQLKTLRYLSNLETADMSVDSVYLGAAKALEKNNKDFPFAIIYKIDEESAIAQPIAFAGINAQTMVLPHIIDLKQPAEGTYNFSHAYQTREMFVSENKGRRKNLPTGGWEIEPTHFIHIPIINARNNHPHAIISAGLNPYRQFDEAYKQFAVLIADQVAAEINDVLAYQEERKKAEALAEIDRAKTAFFTNISHEFRTPLTLILGSLEELLSKHEEEIGSRHKSTIETTHRNAMRLLRLVNSLLDFSRLEAGRAQAHFELTDIAPFTENLAGSFRSVVESAGLTFDVVCDAAIPPVYIDKDSWEKIVLNLLSNAFKNTTTGNIRVILTAAGDQLLLKVEDTGAGIPAAELPKVFQRFHRVQSSGGRSYEGTGIGLALVSELVKMHDGVIGVTSEEGAGTTFTITIPARRPTYAEQQDAGGSITNAVSATFLKEIATLAEPVYNFNQPAREALSPDAATVLVVDDNADLRAHIKSILQKRYKVITASNGIEALEQLKSIAPQIIVSDIMMPQMDGIELVRKVKEDPATEKIPVILLSARAGEESKVEGLETGADDYLTKPFSAKELLARVGANVHIAKVRTRAEKHLYSLLMQIPVAIAIYRGAGFIVEMANDRMLNFYGKTHDEIINKGIFDVVPEIAEHGVKNMYQKVYETGKSIATREQLHTYNKNGKLVKAYYDTLIEPYYDLNGNIIGLIVTGTDVTDAVLFRNKIETNEQRIRNLVEQAPVAMCVLRGSSYLVEVANKKVLELWGKTADQMMNKPVFEAMPDAADQGLEKLLEDVYTTGKPFVANDLPVSLVRNGIKEIVYMNFVYEPLYEADGTISGVVAVATDVSEQVLSRKKIEESEEQLRIAIEGGELGLFDFYPQTGELTWSAKTKQLFGLAPDTPVNYNSFLLGLHPDDKERSNAASHAAMNPEGNGVYENEYRTIGINDNILRWVRSKGKITFNENKQAVRFTGVTQDITAQKKILRSLQLQSLVLERMDEGVLVLDEEGFILLTNAAEDKMFGYGSGELIGKHVTIQNNYPQGENRKMVNGVIGEVKLKGSWSGEWHNRKKDGTAFYTYLYITRLQVDEAVLYVCVQRDVTEEKQAREQLRYAATLTQNIADAVIGTDLNSNIISWNKGAEELYGYSATEVMGKLTDEVLQTGLVQDGEQQDWQLALSTVGHWQGEVIQKTSSGATISVLASVANVRNDKGEISGAITVNKDITERKQIIEQIKVSEETFRSFSNNINNLAWMADGEGSIFWYNQRWYDYTGTALDEMKGWGWQKVHHPDHIDRVVEYVKAGWQKDEPMEITFPLRRFDGEYRWFLTRVVPVKEENGNIYRWIGTNTDIHEQKMAEDRFRTLAETLPQLVWVTDAKGGQEYTSKRWKDYSGLDPEAEISWTVMVHPDDLHKINSVWAASLQTGQSYNAEARLRNSDGDYRWHLVKGEPIKDDEGKIVKWIGAFTDVHDQKTFVEKLENVVDERTKELLILNQELEERNTDLFNTQNFLQTVLDSSVELVTAFDENLNYTFINKKAAEFASVKPLKVLGKHIEEVHPGISKSESYRYLQRALLGEVIHFEQRDAFSRAGSILETFMFPLKRGKKVVGVILLLRDVSSFILLSENLRKSNIELERSNEDLQQFAHVASHDLKEPVRKVKTFSNRLLDEFGTVLPPRAKSYLGKIELAADRMYNMIEGVLLYSSTSGIDKTIEPVNLNEVFKNIETDLEIVIQQKSASINYPLLPTIQGYPILLHQLFYNLVNNSLKFSKNEVSPLIQISFLLMKCAHLVATTHSDCVVIRIMDNGIGFDPVHAHKIFKTFSRLNSKDEYEGTGLGLALCKKIVERHNGTIEADAQEEQGAVFTITLPVNQ